MLAILRTFRPAGPKRANLYWLLLRLNFSQRRKARPFYNARAQFHASALKEANELDSSFSQKVVFSGKKPQETFDMTINVLRNMPEKYGFIQIIPPTIKRDSNKILATSSKLEVLRLFWMRFSVQTNNKDDLLDAWALIAQNMKQVECERDRLIMDNFLDKLCDKLPNFDYGELTEVLYHLSICYRDEPHFRLLSSLLDQELSNKLRKQIDEHTVNVSHSFKVAFIWLKQLMVSPENGLRKGLHNRYLIEHLLTDMLHCLSPEETVFCLFLCGLQREYPGCSEAESDSQGWQIPDKLVRKLEKVLPVVTKEEIGIVCHALHQTHLKIVTEHQELRRIVLNAFLDYPLTEVLRNEFCFSSLAKILKNRGSWNQSAVKEAMNKYEPILEGMTGYTKVRLLQFVTHGKPVDWQRFVSKLCRSLQDNLNTMRLKDLEQLAFCLYYLGYKDEERPNIYERINTAMTRCDWSNVRSGRSLVYLTTILAKSGVFSPENIDRIMEEINKCDLSDLDTDEGLVAAIGMLQLKKQ